MIIYIQKIAKNFQMTNFCFLIFFSIKKNHQQQQSQQPSVWIQINKYKYKDIYIYIYISISLYQYIYIDINIQKRKKTNHNIAWEQFQQCTTTAKHYTCIKHCMHACKRGATFEPLGSIVCILVMRTIYTIYKKIKNK